MKPLLIVHQHNHSHWLNLEAAALQLSPVFDLIILGPEPVAGCSAAATVIHLPSDDSIAIEQLVDALLPYAQQRSHLLMAADGLGRELLPQLAAKLDLPMISGVCAIDDATSWRRFAWAGSVEQQWQGDGKGVCLTIEPTAFTPTVAAEACHPQVVASVQNDEAVLRQVVPLQSSRPSLHEAQTVIVVGRGVDTPQLWQQVEALADKLGAAIGGTRPVIDAGDLPAELQVGQTGQQIAPKLYIGLGVFGASQHMAGIKQAQTVIAINKDADAPLMQLADYKYVAELSDVLPGLMASL